MVAGGRGSWGWANNSHSNMQVRQLYPGSVPAFGLLDFWGLIWQDDGDPHFACAVLVCT